MTSALYDSDPYEQMSVPRGAVRLPLIVRTPPDFDAERLETWPHVDGRLELVEGRLQFMAIVLTSIGELEYSKQDTIAEHPSLPGLSPRVADLFRQLG